VWRAPIATPLRDRADRAVETLDASGRRDAEQARAMLVATASATLNWVLYEGLVALAPEP
jgi:hypothetical protein